MYPPGDFCIRIVLKRLKTNSRAAIYTCREIMGVRLADRRAEGQTQQIGHERRTKAN